MAQGSATAILYFVVLMILAVISLGRRNPLRKNRRYRRTMHRFRKHQEPLLTGTLVCAAFFISYFALSKAVDSQNKVSADPVEMETLESYRNELMARSLFMGGGIDIEAEKARLQKSGLLKDFKKQFQAGPGGMPNMGAMGAMGGNADMMKQLRGYGISHQ